jgi:hypothetical protein
VLALRWNEKKGSGARRKAVRIEFLDWIDGDLPGTRWKVDRRYWADGSSCFHAILWGTNPAGVFTTFYPVKMVQLPWKDAPRVLMQFLGCYEKSPAEEVR